MVRLLPMSVTGVTCNIIIALVVAHVDLVYLVGTSPPLRPPSTSPTNHKHKH